MKPRLVMLNAHSQTGRKTSQYFEKDSCDKKFHGILQAILFYVPCCEIGEFLWIFVTVLKTWS